jgi:hypothetical protein
MKNWAYKRVVAPEDYEGPKYMGRYCLEHHLVWWKHHQSVVPDGHVLHHKNEDPRDNRIENLELLTASEHSKRHAEERAFAAQEEAQCGTCSAVFTLSRSKLSQRKKQSDSGLLFCSKKCSVAKQQASKKKKPVRHGTVVGYSYHRCRCDLCVQGQRDRMRIRRSGLKGR